MRLLFAGHPRAPGFGLPIIRVAGHLLRRGKGRQHKPHAELPRQPHHRPRTQRRPAQWAHSRRLQLLRPELRMLLLHPRHAIEHFLDLRLLLDLRQGPIRRRGVNLPLQGSPCNDGSPCGRPCSPSIVRQQQYWHPLSHFNLRPLRRRRPQQANRACLHNPRQRPPPSGSPAGPSPGSRS